jgi:hypothetical protein
MEHQDPILLYKRLGSVTIWTRGRTGDLSEFSKLLPEIVANFKKNAVFKNWDAGTSTPTGQNAYATPIVLPSGPIKFGVIIDGNWSGSSGFYSPDLQTPDGEPAFLLAPESATLGADAISALVSHELTHLIHSKIRPSEETWLREGAALLAEYVVTGRLNPIFAVGFKDPESSLIGELHPISRDYFGPQHGHLLQYFYYLYRLCGREVLLKYILFSNSDKKGVQFLDQALRDLTKQNSTDIICSDFKTSFVAFEVARFTQSPYTSNGFVTATTNRATIRSLTPVSNEPMEPYSAFAYPKPCLLRSDISFDRGCIRIRID